MGVEHYTILRPIAESLYFHETYAEIGASDGATYNRIAPLFRRHVAVDIAPIGHFLCEGAEFYQMTSDDFFKHVGVSLKDIDLAFIDADHRREYVLRDFENALKIIRPYSGLVALHDMYPPSQEMISGGCWDAWEVALEIRKMPTVEMIVLPVTCMGICLCRYVPDEKKSLHWMS